jgi:hypothetical protein
MEIDRSDYLSRSLRLMIFGAFLRRVSAKLPKSLTVDVWDGKAPKVGCSVVAFFTSHLRQNYSLLWRIVGDISHR